MRIHKLLVTLAFAGSLFACAHHQTPAEQVKLEPTSPGSALEIGTQEITYKAGDTELKGFLAFPASAVDKRPGVLVVHEWWGATEYVKMRARKLAELGYVAFAVDLYGAGRATMHAADAKAFMEELMKDPTQAAARFEAGKAVLAADPHVDPSRIAAIGYCLGGAQVLAAARRGDDFKAVASFHGNYATQAPLQPGVFKGKVFVAHGGDDSFTTPEQVEGIQKELKDAGADYEFVSYPGAKHGFTNPDATEAGKANNIPVAYNAEADAQSWTKLQEILAKAFSQS